MPQINVVIGGKSIGTGRSNIASARDLLIDEMGYGAEEVATALAKATPIGGGVAQAFPVVPGSRTLEQPLGRQTFDFPQTSAEASQKLSERLVQGAPKTRISSTPSTIPSFLPAEQVVVPKESVVEIPSAVGEEDIDPSTDPVGFLLNLWQNFTGGRVETSSNVDVGGGTSLYDPLEVGTDPSVTPAIGDMTIQDMWNQYQGTLGQQSERISTEDLRKIVFGGFTRPEGVPASGLGSVSSSDPTTRIQINPFASKRPQVRSLEEIATSITEEGSDWSIYGEYSPKQVLAAIKTFKSSGEITGALLVAGALEMVVDPRGGLTEFTEGAGLPIGAAAAMTFKSNTTQQVMNAAQLIRAGEMDSAINKANLDELEARLELDTKIFEEAQGQQGVENAFAMFDREMRIYEFDADKRIQVGQFLNNVYTGQAEISAQERADFFDIILSGMELQQGKQRLDIEEGRLTEEAAANRDRALLGMASVAIEVADLIRQGEVDAATNLLASNRLAQENYHAAEDRAARERMAAEELWTRQLINTRTLQSQRGMQTEQIRASQNEQIRRLEAANAIAQLQHSGQLSQAILANPFAYAASQSLGGLPGFGGVTGLPAVNQNPFISGLAPLDFGIPAGMQPGQVAPSTEFFQQQPTLGALGQIDPSSLQFLSQLLNFTGTTPEDFLRQAANVSLPQRPPGTPRITTTLGQGSR